MTTKKPRSAEVILYQGDDLQRLTDLRRAADVAERIAQEPPTEAPRGGDVDPRQTEAKAARDAYDAFVDEAAERATRLVVNALPRKVFRALMTDHPPRKVDGEDGKQVIHEDDVVYGVNMDTFPESFLAGTDEHWPDPRRRSVAEPQFDTRAELVEFIDGLSEGEFDDVFAKAYLLNRAGIADPRSSRYSNAPPSSDAI